MIFALTLTLLMVPVLAGLAYAAKHIVAEELERAGALRRLDKLSATWRPHHHEDHEALMRHERED